MAIRDGEARPLFDSASAVPYSPSPSLIIERHDVQPTGWQTVTLPDQVVTLFLQRCTLEYETDSGSSHHLVRKKGSVVIEKRSLEHRLRWNSFGSVLLTRISDAVLEHAAKATSLTEDGASADSADRDSRLSYLLLALERERRNGFPAGRLFVDGVEQALAAILVRYDGVARRANRFYCGGLAPYRMKRVTEFVQAHIETDITLDDLAGYVGLSPSHFCNLFRKTWGTTPHQYVQGCRIHYAKALLTKKGHSILDVALASGFRTHQHFSRIFHRHVGISPSRYRTQL
jgi:AraC family transcriptional regulator